MNLFIAAPVLLPLALAMIFALVGVFLPRRVVDVLSVAASLVSLTCLLALARASFAHPIVSWFGAWRPEGHLAVGVAFQVDPLGAGLASLVCFLGIVAFLFAWGYFEEVRAQFHALLLIFLAAMTGFCLTGDLFNLFVWFELMSASAVALCGYKSDEVGPLQGALNFAIMNTIGAVLTVMGIALLYAHTGALNLAQIGDALTRHPPSAPFLTAAFLFVSAGFFVKAAVFPFHFWLADAHAVAPTPVCLLFSGVMVELGLYAVARLYWAVFAGPAAASAVEPLLVTVGVFSVLVGSLLCFGQRHLKRLLAFSTIAHVGIMLLGIALLSPQGLVGTSLYVLGHGLVKATLFVGAGIFLNRFSSVDEYELKGRARRTLGTEGVVWLLAALGLTGLPPFGTFLGDAALAVAARAQARASLPWVLMFAHAVTGGAVLRFFARVFLGWGTGRDVTTEGAIEGRGLKKETEGDPPGLNPFMLSAAILPLVFALGRGLFPSVRRFMQTGSAQFVATAFYRRAAFGETLPALSPVPAVPLSSADFAQAGATLALALALAALSLFQKSVLVGPLQPIRRALRRLMHGLHALHTGTIGDAVAWLAAGLAAYGALLGWGGGIFSG